MKNRGYDWLCLDCTARCSPYNAACCTSEPLSPQARSAARGHAVQSSGAGTSDRSGRGRPMSRIRRDLSAFESLGHHEKASVRYVGIRRLPVCACRHHSDIARRNRDEMGDSVQRATAGRRDARHETCVRVGRTPRHRDKLHRATGCCESACPFANRCSTVVTRTGTRSLSLCGVHGRFDPRYGGVGHVSRRDRGDQSQRGQ